MVTEFKNTLKKASTTIKLASFTIARMIQRMQINKCNCENKTETRKNTPCTLMGDQSRKNILFWLRVLLLLRQLR